MLQLHIPGSQTADSGAAIETVGASGILNLAVVRRISVAAVGGGTAAVSVTVAADEVVELELADGQRLWVCADRLDQYQFRPSAGGQLIEDLEQPRLGMPGAVFVA